MHKRINKSKTEEVDLIDKQEQQIRDSENQKP